MSPRFLHIYPRNKHQCLMYKRFSSTKNKQPKKIVLMYSIKKKNIITSIEQKEKDNKNKTQDSSKNKNKNVKRQQQQQQKYVAYIIIKTLSRKYVYTAWINCVHMIQCREKGRGSIKWHENISTKVWYLIGGVLGALDNSFFVLYSMLSLTHSLTHSLTFLMSLCCLLLLKDNRKFDINFKYPKNKYVYFIDQKLTHLYKHPARHNIPHTWIYI